MVDKHATKIVKLNDRKHRTINTSKKLEEYEKVMLILVPDNFEDVELITTLDVLSRNKIEYEIFSLGKPGRIKGKYNAIVKARGFNQIEALTYMGIFLPGGPGTENYFKNKNLSELLDEYNRHEKIIAAICAAPKVLFDYGIIGDRKFTAFPKVVKSENNTGEEVVIDGHIITGRDFECTLDFAKALVEEIKKR